MKRGYQMLISKTNESKISWSDKKSVKVASLMSIYRGKGLEEIPDLNEVNPIKKFISSNGCQIPSYEKYDINQINTIYW